MDIDFTIKVENNPDLIPETPDFQGFVDIQALAGPESGEEEFIVPEILEKANEVINNDRPPERSRPRYETIYNKFVQWKTSKKIDSLSESVFLTYFNELAETRKPSSLWATYSMLRRMVDIKHNINIYNYRSLVAFLKQKNKGFKSPKASTLNAEHINKFLREAPDNQYLATKVALILGVQGACRRKELTDLTIDDLEDKGDMLLVKIPDHKTGRPRTFVVTDEFYHIYKKYAKLRPTNLATKRFFVNYRGGKCTTQNIGINTFGNMPKKVATFLKLANAESYTGHSFKRTSATLLADSGVYRTHFKRHEAWKSSAVAKAHLKDSMGNEEPISQQITSTTTSKPSTSKANKVINDPIPEISRKKYESAYIKLIQWQTSKKIKSLSETVFLTYFKELAKTLKPSSLWATYSMLRTMVDIKHNINIYNYSRLIAFLKQKNKGFKSTKASTLNADHIKQFLREAPDSQYLAIKVALIIGVQGACSRKELTELTLDNLEDKGDMLLVNIPDSQAGRARSFVVTGDFYHIYKKYANSRPTDLATKSFFVSYRCGKCTSKKIGINHFGSMAKTVATFLKLANPETYTGHTFRRPSATLLADSRGALTAIKQRGEWKSGSVAEVYLEDSGADLSATEQHEQRKSSSVAEGYLEDSVADLSAIKQHEEWTSSPAVEGYLDDSGADLSATEQHEQFKSSSVAECYLEDSGADLTVIKQHEEWTSSPVAESYLEDSGADLTAIKQHEEWTSSPVAESNLKDSVGNKIDQEIASTITSKPSTSKANRANSIQTPEKSRQKYEATYKKFIQWQRSKDISSLSETVFLTYFNELAETLKPSSLWATYSMLRSMVDIKHNINIYNYSTLIAFLKHKNKGFKSTKAATLNAEHIDKFLNEAPDNQYLAIKVALIFGVQGACRRKELTDLTIDNLEDKGDMLLVKIRDTRSGKARSFVVTDDYYRIYKKYAKLRPANIATRRFFVNYRDGKCTSQNIGINTFGGMPKTVATFLKLANPESYTGHSFRRTSATLLADSGADLYTIKRNRELMSSSAEGYLEDSSNEKRINQEIASTVISEPSTSKKQQPQVIAATEFVEAPTDVTIKCEIDHQTWFGADIGYVQNFFMQ